MTRTEIAQGLAMDFSEWVGTQDGLADPETVDSLLWALAMDPDLECKLRVRVSAVRADLCREHERVDADDEPAEGDADAVRAACEDAYDARFAGVGL